MPDANFCGQGLEDVFVQLHIMVPPLAEPCPPAVLVVIIFPEGGIPPWGHPRNPRNWVLHTIWIGGFPVSPLKLMNHCYPVNVLHGVPIYCWANVIFSLSELLFTEKYLFTDFFTFLSLLHLSFLKTGEYQSLFLLWMMFVLWRVGLLKKKHLQQWGFIVEF